MSHHFGQRTVTNCFEVAGMTVEAAEAAHEALVSLHNARSSSTPGVYCEL